MQHRSVFILRSDEVGWVALEAALPTLANISLVGEAATLPEAECALALLPHEPELVLAASHLNGVSVVPLLQRLRETYCPTSRIAIFASDFQTGDLLEFAQIGGVSCLLWRDLCCLTLPSCLATLSSSDVIVSSRTTVSSFIDVLRHAPSCERAVPLTRREENILGRLGQGMTREQIARVEGMSLRTVNRIVSRLEEKFDAPNLFVLGMRSAWRNHLGSI